MPLIKKLSERNKLGEISKDRLQPLKFIKEGVSAYTLKSSKKVNGGKGVDYRWLSKGSDWKVSFDLSELKQHCNKYLPQDLCDSRSEIDAFMISKESKICILGPENTVPMEENILLEWQLKKSLKYCDNLHKRFRQGLETHVMTIEVGCKGFVSPSFHHSFKNLGCSNKEIDELKNTCSNVARLSSLISIWLSKFSRDFNADCPVDIDMDAFKRVAQL